MNSAQFVEAIKKAGFKKFYVNKANNNVYYSNESPDLRIVKKRGDSAYIEGVSSIEVTNTKVFFNCLSVVGHHYRWSSLRVIDAIIKA